MCLSFGVFSVYAPKVAFAEDNVEDYARPEELMQYYTNGGYSEAEADQFARELEVVFGEAISIESGYIVFDPDNVEPTMDNHEELVEFITANVNAINQLVEEGVGCVDDYGEFHPSISDEYAMRYAAWNFKLKWNRVSVNLFGDFATASSLILLMAKIYFHGQSFSVKEDFGALEDRDYLEDLIHIAYNDGCSAYIQSKIAVIDELATINSIYSTFMAIKNIVQSANLYLKIINVVMDLLLPSIADCLITLYNSILFNRGVGIIGCWFPWRGNSLGVSLSVI
jgi:hypothetical protein